MRPTAYLHGRKAIRAADQDMQGVGAPPVQLMDLLLPVLASQ